MRCSPQAPSRVMVVQMEDLLGLEDQANLPGTVNEHPNWRRKLPVTLEAMAADERVASLARRVAQLRPRIAPAAQAGRGRAQHPVIPRATYRLQLHGGFGFDDAALILPYLARLGVSHVYCSPILRARPGSLHGYDVVAHDEINPELGGPEGFERFCAALEAQGLGLLLDMVPNHMGVLGADNPWWMDVLENGPASRYARHFDIDWQPAHPELQGKVLLPVLGDHYGDVLERGELRLAPGGGHRHLGPALFRPPLSARPAHLSRGAGGGTPGAVGCPGRRRVRAAARGLCRAAGARSRGRGLAPAPCRGAGPAQATLRRTGAAARGGAGARCGDRGHQRRPGARRAARAARAAGVSARLLARGGRRDQLPALLRHQRAGRAAHGGAGGVRGHAGLRARPGRGRTRRRPAHRPSGRAARPGAVLRAPAGRLCAPRRHRAQAKASGRSTWSPRRSSRRTRTSRATGRSTARPATASRWWWAACWSMPAPARSSTACGAASPASGSSSRKSPTRASAR